MTTFPSTLHPDTLAELAAEADSRSFGHTRPTTPRLEMEAMRLSQPSFFLKALTSPYPFTGQSTLKDPVG